MMSLVFVLHEHHIIMVHITWGWHRHDIIMFSLHLYCIDDIIMYVIVTHMSHDCCHGT